MDAIQGKHFSITDPEGIKTVIYEVKKKIGKKLPILNIIYHILDIVLLYIVHISWLFPSVSTPTIVRN